MTPEEFSVVIRVILGVFIGMVIGNVAYFFVSDKFEAWVNKKLDQWRDE